MRSSGPMLLDDELPPTAPQPSVSAGNRAVSAPMPPSDAGTLTRKRETGTVSAKRRTTASSFACRTNVWPRPRPPAPRRCGGGWCPSSSSTKNARMGQSFAGIGPRIPGLRLVCQQHGRGLRHGHARHARHGAGRPADDLRIDRAVRAEQQPRHASGLLRVQEIAALLPEFLADAGLAAALDDDALLRGADRAVVERLRAEDVPHGAGDVGRAVDIGRAVARADADGGFAGRIGRADHGPAARGEDETHLRACSSSCTASKDGIVRQEIAPFGHLALGSLRHEAGGVERAAHGVRMGREDDGTARLQGDEGL